MQQGDSDSERAGNSARGSKGSVGRLLRSSDLLSYRWLEPRNNLSVWKISLSTDVRNADKSNRFLDIYLDADTGKIYEFYVRTGQQWEDIDTDAMIDRYAEYLDLTGLEKYEDQNPLLETTPYFAKYTFPGEEDDSTTVTIGYYEGIRELFLKVGR